MEVGIEMACGKAIGAYNPDCALVLDTDQGEKLYFVAETKGTENSL